MSIDVASLGVQVHGGMGFIEETGAAQYYRDARILTIYEGTTAIQANDLIGRKTVRDGGAAAQALLAQIDADRSQRSARSDGAGVRVDAAVTCAARAALAERASSSSSRTRRAIRTRVFAGSVPYLKLAGIVLGGLADGACAARGERKARRRRSVLRREDRDRAFLRGAHAAAGVGARSVDRQREGQQGVLALREDQF